MTTEAALYRLMTWLSPSYPLGAFSYSHGLEYAIETGLVRNGDSLAEWIATVLEIGAGFSDGALLAAAWSAAKTGDDAALYEVTALAQAWRGTAETALESAAQGAAFLATTRAAWPHPLLDALSLRYRGALALAVAVGVAGAVHDVPQPALLTAYLHAFAANLVSAGVRLIPLGQSAGQRVIAALEPVIAAVARRIETTPFDEIGTAAPLVDWCSMQHETQYTRLFRS